jgi:hypothetical protein
MSEKHNVSIFRTEVTKPASQPKAKGRDLHKCKMSPLTRLNHSCLWNAYLESEKEPKYSNCRNFYAKRFLVLAEGLHMFILGPTLTDGNMNLTGNLIFMERIMVGWMSGSCTQKGGIVLAEGLCDLGGGGGIFGQGRPQKPCHWTLYLTHFSLTPLKSNLPRYAPIHVAH